MAEQIKQWFLDIKDTKNCIRVGYGGSVDELYEAIAVVFFCKALYQLAKFFTHIQMILL